MATPVCQESVEGSLIMADKKLLAQVEKNDDSFKAGESTATEKFLSNIAAITEAYLRETGQIKEDDRIRLDIND